METKRNKKREREKKHIIIMGLKEEEGRDVEESTEWCKNNQGIKSQLGGVWTIQAKKIMIGAECTDKDKPEIY